MKRWAGDIDPTFDGARGPGFEITQVWIIACDDGRGAEGVPGFIADGRVMFPLFASDERGRDGLVVMARRMAADPAAKGRRFYLVRFTGREVLEEIRP